MKKNKYEGVEGRKNQATFYLFCYPVNENLTSEWIEIKELIYSKEKIFLVILKIEQIYIFLKTWWHDQIPRN